MDLTTYIRADMASLRTCTKKNPADRQSHNSIADQRLVEYARWAIEEKLQASRAKGRGGWWDEADCPIERLREMLREHVEKGDMRDVMVLAAMIHAREVADLPAVVAT